MEYNIKKKTKHHINLKTNNFIHQNTQKDAFFNQLLNTLKQQLDPKQFAFLTTYLLYQQNPLKKHKTQQKLHTHSKISTLPDQRNFNINQIDPTIFQQTQSKRNLLQIQKLQNFQTQRNKCCTATPRQRIKEVVFQNKKTLNLDKKLTKKYFQPESTRFSESSCQKNIQSTKAKFFIPKFQGLLSSTSRNRTFQSNFYPMSKISIKRFTKRNTSKDQNLRRLKTSIGPRDNEDIRMLNSFGFPKFRQSEFEIKNLKFRKSEFTEGKQQTQRFRKSQNSIPKQFMDQVLLSRKQSKKRLLNRDFSDYKINFKYKNFMY